MSASVIDRFFVGSDLYFHVIHTDDDRIELQDDGGNVVLTYTANGYVVKPDKSYIGRFHLRDNMHRRSWVLAKLGEEPGSPDVLVFGHDLIRAEIDLSKMFIKGELK